MPLGTGDDDAYAVDINNAGIVIVNVYRQVTYLMHSFVWLPVGTKVALPRAGNDVETNVQAVSEVFGTGNSQSVYVVGESRADGNSGRSVRWTVNIVSGTVSEVRVLNQAWSEGVNSAGDVAGTVNAAGKQSASLWRGSAGTYTELKPPKGGTGGTSRGMARTETSPTFVVGQTLQPVFDAAGTLDNTSWNHEPKVGCGPYVFSDWESGSYTRFMRNENYYGEPAKIDEIYIRIIPDSTAQTTALVNGDIDLSYLPPYSELPALSDAGIVIAPVSAGYNEGWFANLSNNPIMQDVKVRQAVAMCVDRASYVDKALFGYTYVSTSFWTGNPWQDPGLKPWPYDPERAKQLLEDDGWTDSNSDGIREKGTDKIDNGSVCLLL